MIRNCFFSLGKKRGSNDNPAQFAPQKSILFMIKGPCRTCEKAEECYGCRGAAFQMTGDYLASDPTCWRNAANNER